MKINNVILLASAIGALFFTAIGYSIAGETVYRGLIAGTSALAIDLPIQPSNVLIEIGRWFGILFALNVIFQLVRIAFQRTADSVRLKRQLKRDDAIAVHGEGVFASTLAQNMGDRAILSEEPRSFDAPVQVVIGNTDEDTLDYLGKHEEELSGKELYISLEDPSEMLSANPSTYYFCMYDIAAQLYWEQYPVTTTETIAIIGSTEYAYSILTQGLLVNLFSVEGGVKYKVYGDYSEYRHTHLYLDEMMSVNADTLEFFYADWHDDIEYLLGATRIILCSTSGENLRIAQDLRDCNYSGTLFVRLDNDVCIAPLQNESARSAPDTVTPGEKKTIIFGTAQQLCTEAIVIQEDYHDAGKIIDIANNIGTGKCDDCLRKLLPAGGGSEKTPSNGAEGAPTAALSEEEKRECMRKVDYKICISCERFKKWWNGYDNFTRMSNYAAAAHDSQKLRLLEQYAEKYQVSREEVFDLLSSVDYAALEDPAHATDGSVDAKEIEKLKDLDTLQEIEHIRWCRFHFLNNWHYGKLGESEGNKNKQTRTHKFLTPYSQLSREIKNYDGDLYRSLFVRNNGLR